MEGCRPGIYARDALETACQRLARPSELLRGRLTRRKNGTGIGVVIARSIVQHGGALTYASRPEGGTIATIKLPVCDAQRPFRL